MGIVRGRTAWRRAAADVEATGSLVRDGWVPLVAWVVLAAAAAVLVQRPMQLEREQQVELLDVRTASLGQLLEGEIIDLQTGLSTGAVDWLADETVAPEDLRAVVVGLGFEAGAVFDSEGRYLSSTAFRPEVVGEDFTTRLEHLQVAEVQGRPAVSQVVVSPGLDTAAVGVAVPYATPYGRRIVTGVLTLRQGSLASLLRLDLDRQVGALPAQVDLVDRDGNVMASSRAAVPAAVVAYEDWDAPAAAALVTADMGTYEAAGTSMVFSSAVLPSTGWRLVVAETESTLFEPVTRSQTTRWLVFTAVALLGLLAALSGARELHRRRSVERELRQLNDRLEVIVAARTEELEGALEVARTGEQLALQHAAVVEAAGEAIIGLDGDGRITSWNAAAERLYGYTKREAVGASVLMLGEGTRHARLIATVTEEHRPASSLAVTFDRDGARHEVEVSMAPILDGAGALLGGTAIHLDVTERRRAFAERMRAMAMFETVFVSGSPMALGSLDGELSEANQAFCDMLGLTREEALEKNVLALTAEQDRERTAQYFEALRRGETSTVQVRKHYRHADGHLVVGLLQLSLVPASGDDDPLLVAVVQDITELTRAQEEVAQSERRFRALVQHAEDVILQVAVDGTILAVSDAVRRIAGLDPADVIGRAIADFLPRASEQDVLASVARLLAGEDVRGRVTTLHRDGEVLHLDYVASDLREDPSVGSLVVTVHDVTDVVTAERERAAQAKALRELNEQLRVALEVRDNILDATTHELRTPLTPMVGLLELLRERFDHLDRATIADYLDVLRRNTDRLTALVEDLLFATNLRSGQVSAVPTAVRVLPAVTRAAHRYLKTASAEVTGAEAVVWCDPEHLDQVLNALLGNAARHGRPPYRVDVTEVDGAVQIMVVDGGSGIPQDHVEALFEPFLQGSMGDQRTATRLGLGLPIARALIRANGGDLSYEPTADGAAFRIELPTPRWERAASSTRRTEA